MSPRVHIDTHTRYVGQRLLLWLVLWYRRRLSGRGPLTRVHCTFAHTESCSAYGLRMALEAGSLVQAVRLIFARLRRCGTTSLYQLPDSISWGEAYDDCDPAELDKQLAAARETTETRAQLHRTAGLVATRTGRINDAREHLTRAAALCDTSPRPCVRNASRLVRSLRTQLWRRVALLTAAAVALGWVLDGPVLWIGLFVLFTCALSSTAAHRRRTRRHDNLRVASIFTVPADPG